MANTIYLACFPKSGSTFLNQFLCSLLKWERVSGAPVSMGGAHNEQNILESRLKIIVGGNVVVQQHTKGTLRNVQLMKKYNISPTVLVRNIFDIVVSVHDHIENEDDKGPAVYIHPEYHQMTFTEKIDFLIFNALPWYFSFFVS